MDYEQFEEFINDIHPPIELMGYTFDASEILKKLDPIAYKEEFNMFLQWVDLNNSREGL